MSRPEMTDFDLLALAAEHTAAGLPSLPVVLIEQEDGTTAKIPATRGCRGYLDATVDDEEFLRDVAIARKIGPALAAGRRWCIGVGVVPGDGDAIILDCDVKHGSLGLETLETLKARYGNEIEAVRWRSISGGVNLALRKPRRRISNRAPKDWVGIDIRADSGFVVAPGTWTPWGEWAWEQGEWSDLGVMPDEMAAELPDASPDGKDVPPVDRHEVVAFLAGSPRTSSPAAQTAFNAKLTELQAMTTGNRHPKLVNVVGWTFGMRALNIDKAMQDIDTVWGGLLRPDEVRRRAGEAWEVAHWVAEREIHNRTIDQALGDSSLSSPLEWSDAHVGDPQDRRLPDEWWQQTPQLTHLRNAADARAVGREALLLFALANAVLHVPPAFALPPPPRPGSPNLIVIQVARSGGGKGTNSDAADEVVPAPADALRFPLGTAEGFVKTFFHKNPAIDKEERAKFPLVQHTHAVRVNVDEIGAYFAQTGKNGSRNAPGEGLTAQLKQAVSGEYIGHGYATDEKRLICKPHTYRFALTCSTVPSKAEPLFSDTGGGLPERMLFAQASPATVPDKWEDLPPFPGRLDWSPPWLAAAVDGEIQIDDDVRAEVLNRWLAARGEDNQTGDELDVHVDYLRLKLAIPLGGIHGVGRVTRQYFDMAGDIITMSTAVRAWLRACVTEERRSEHGNADNRFAQRQATSAVATADALQARESNRILTAARKLWELARDGRADTISDARRLMRSFTPKELEAGVEHAVDHTWLIVTAEDTTSGGSQARRISLGQSRPA